MSILRTALVVALVSAGSATLADGPRVDVNVTNAPGAIIDINVIVQNGGFLPMQHAPAPSYFVTDCLLPGGWAPVTFPYPVPPGTGCYVDEYVTDNWGNQLYDAWGNPAVSRFWGYTAW